MCRTIVDLAALDAYFLGEAPDGRAVYRVRMVLSDHP